MDVGGVSGDPSPRLTALAPRGWAGGTYWLAVHSRTMHPSSIGRYRIVGVLGEGGMGTVYEAVQEQPQRTVALKVIRPDYVTPELSRRFARESEVLGRLQHPGIAQVYEAGTAEGPYGPQSYFAMELIRGSTLLDYTAGQHLQLQQRLELFARICDAVHYAHQQGVVHRDLKPANIMVDGAGMPKILDFGVARLTNADAQATRQTTVGQVVGTLQYMSPEQVNADAVPVDARSDVYSLGVILYELVSGRTPYDLTKKMIYEAIKVILVDEPTPLSSIDRRLGGDVEIIVGKALEKERTRRYDSADALASDVRRFLRDEPIVARPTSAIYQLRKFARRNRALVNGIALAAATLLVGTAVSLWLAVRATAAERLADARRRDAVAATDLAVQRRVVADSALRVADSARAVAQREQAAALASAKRASGEAAKSQAINTFLQRMLASSDPENARGKNLTVREVLDQASTGAAATSLSSQPEVRAAVTQTIGRTYFGLGLYDQARPQLDSAYAIRRRTLGAGDLSVAESADDLGKLASAAGDVPLAERRLNEALATMRATLSPTDDRISSALATLGDVRQQQGKFAESEKLYRESLRLTRARHGKDAVEVAAPLRVLGSLLAYTGHAAEAETLLVQAVSILRRAHGSNHPAVVGALITLSDAQLNRPDFVAAEKTLRETLSLAHALYGQEHPVIADVLSRLGTALVRQGRLDEPEPLFRQALAMRIKLLGDQHPDVQLARVELGRYLQARQRYEEADTLYTLALTARRALLGDGSPAVAASLMDVGLLAGLREDWPRAEQELRASARIWHAAQIQDQELYVLAELGRVLERQDRFREADSVLTDVLARRRALFGDSHWSVGDTYTKLSLVAIGLQRPLQAESLATMGLSIARKVYGTKAPPTIAPLSAVALAVEARGDSLAAIALWRELLSLLASRPPTDASVISTRRTLAIDLCATGAAAQGDSLIRATIAQANLDSTQIVSYRTQSAGAFCLTTAGRLDEAEPILLRAEAGLSARGASARREYTQTVAWLVYLYERWGKPEQAAAWRAKRPR